MITFLTCIALLILGYLVYGAFVEKIFHPDDRETPCTRLSDGVDYTPLPAWRIFLIQLLNIAGLGPIFGALSGAIWGPGVMIWIVLGTIFAGAVHDYLSAMLSMRHDGASVAELTGIYLGSGMKMLIRIFSVILLIMVGTVFMVGPAGLIAMLTPDILNIQFWTIVILIYYFIATFLPIDKVIGKLYPIFGICLLIMAVGIAGAIMYNDITGQAKMMEITLSNLHPNGNKMWPFLFITVACGAISGFHATQSPMMARCMTTEKNGRRIFYGAMIAEGIIALIWAAAGCAFYEKTGGLMTGLFAAGGGNSTAVYDISMSLLGPVGGVLAMIGVIACPITTGDTAFRSARLTIADWFRIDQNDGKKRLALTAPLLIAGYLISFIDYSIVWRYFAWSNQTLAMITLWTCSTYLAKYVSKKASLITVVPAVFMSVVTMTYILVANEGLGLSTAFGYPAGIIFAVVLLGIFLKKCIFVNDERLS